MAVIIQCDFCKSILSKDEKYNILETMLHKGGFDLCPTKVSLKYICSKCFSESEYANEPTRK